MIFATGLVLRGGFAGRSGSSSGGGAAGNALTDA
jgi:hypothetical protein